ncbi:MAG TPA: hypothetical protein VD788_14325 [Candidatus Polarisedimenticolaceae bacterium]|nr:hypothetical protein [Candidatus Polarisedimenticolaceae bacterium]
MIPVLAVLSAAIYGALAFAGDLTQRPTVLYGGCGLLLAAMWAAWCLSRGGATRLRPILAAALLFRLIAACGPPALSDDVYRYVWDGRVQLHGIHPYLFAPTDPRVEALRDENWRRINHPQLITIYPPVSQLLFAALAASGAGPGGFRIALGLVDFGVVLALSLLLRRLGLPGERVVLYAWNPLAVLEASGSGHVEPLGIAFVLLATAWIIGCRHRLSTAALAAAIHVKLLPVVLIPVFAPSYRIRGVVWLVLWLLVLWAPYGLSGPAFGAGLWAYAESWEHNSSIFALVETALVALDSGRLLEPLVSSVKERSGAAWVPWDSLYRWLWPPGLARALVAGAGIVWVVAVARRDGIPLARRCLLAIGGVLLLSPTLHPWYVLWVLPFAAALLSWPWLVLAALVPLSYLGAGADPPPWVLLVEYGMPCGIVVVDRLARRSTSYAVDR